LTAVNNNICEKKNKRYTHINVKRKEKGERRKEKGKEKRHRSL